MKRSLLFLWVSICSLALVACLRASMASPDGPATAPPSRPDTRTVSPWLQLPLADDKAVSPSAVLSTQNSGDLPWSALRLAVDQGPGPQQLSRTLLRDLAGDGHTLRLVGAGRRAELYIGYDPPQGFHTWPLTPTRFVPVVSFWLPVAEVTYADLERIFRGEVGRWSELGSSSVAPVIPLVLQTRPLAPLQPAAAAPLPDADALVAALEQTVGGIALVPLEQVDARMRVLPVDGRDPLLEHTVSPQDPLVRHLHLALSPTVPPAAAEWLAAFARRQEVALPPPIEIVAVGDIMPGRAVERRILEEGGDYVFPFAAISATLRQADLTIANLEGVLSNKIEPPSDRQTMLFVASGSFCEGLRAAGVDAVSLANNHSMNFGVAGMGDTLSLLREAGIVAFGAGMGLEEARRPALFDVKGTRFAFLGYDGVSQELYGAGEERAGSAPAYPNMIAADIAAARQRADVVISYFHWGWEYTCEPSAWQRQLAHQAVDAGADVVLGSHPHWVQGLEHYRGAVILYSLGNFVFDQMWSLETRQGVIAHLIFHGNRLLNLRLEAVQIEDDYQPSVLSAAEAEEVFRRMRDVGCE